MQRESSSGTADLVLLGVSVFWGTSFALIKEVLSFTSPENLLFIRFLLACLLLLPLAWRRRKAWSRRFLGPGLLIGLLLFGAFLTQAWGLVYTSASRSGFITGISVILVPFLSTIIFRRAPDRLALGGAVLAFLGIYLLTSTDQTQSLPLNRGDFLTLICATLWAAHIIALGRYSPRGDTFWLAFVQITTACLGNFLWGGFAGKLDPGVPVGVWGAAFYLAFTCTVLAYLGQTWAQARTSPTRTAIILSMEPVFAVLFASIWLGERMGGWGWTGAGLILAGVVLAEIKPGLMLRHETDRP